MILLMYVYVGGPEDERDGGEGVRNSTRCGGESKADSARCVGYGQGHCPEGQRHGDWQGRRIQELRQGKSRGSEEGHERQVKLIKLLN